MYTGHFGLDDGPFHGKAEGEEVYVGPQQATVTTRLRKTLGRGDTAVAVSGPVGVGKTTLVRRAIADIAGRKIVIPVDRIRLEPDEVLDLLLSRFDVSRPPKGTIQRVAAFRRLLQEKLSDDVRVFIIVEDAERVGVDALLELEALTATDGGEPVGANIVLMGDSEMPALLVRPALARLRQRVRLRQVVAPFDAAEVEGYMRHCLEAAGGVLEQIFEPGTARIVHRYSGGIARVVDNLCESALVAAAEAGLATILPEFLQEVAENCGLEPQVVNAGDVVNDPDETESPGVDDAVDEAVADTVAEDSFADAEQEPADAAVAPPKLALVAKPPMAAGAAFSDDTPAPQDEPEAETPDSPPPVDAVAEEETEVAPVASSPEEQWKARSASLTVSRIDEVLPELIERLQSSARGRSPSPAFALPSVPQAGDDNDIPTLSSSMRVAVLPVRRMDERPVTAENVGDDGIPEEMDDDFAELAADEALVRQHGSPTEDASGPASDEDTGIAEALSESNDEPPAAPEATEAICDDALHPPEPVEATADEVLDEPERIAATADEVPDEPEPVAETAADAVDEPEAAAARAEESIIEAAPKAEESEEPAASDENESPVAEIVEAESVEDADASTEPPPPELAGPWQQPEAATDTEQPAAESASTELSLVSDDSFSLGTVVAEESVDDETTDAATLSADDEVLTLAPDAATDVFVAENVDEDDGEPELDALQAAIQAANAWQASDDTGAIDEKVAAPTAASGPGLPEMTPEITPEITLDAELEKQKPSPTEQLDQWAEEISKAKSLEDISDFLAETIFGNEEIEAISAEIRAKKAAEKAASEPAPAPVRKPAPARPEAAQAPQKPAAARSAATRPVPSPRKAPPPAPPRQAAGGINMTMSQRIQMVNALKGGKPAKPLRPLAGMSVAEIVLAEQPDDPLPRAAGNAPAPIESQIDTAMTQSRKVLSAADLARMASPDDSDDDGSKKGSRGLFGFFRRSSKN